MLAQIVLFDGFDPLDVIAPYEVLAAGGMFGGRMDAELVSAEGAREVHSGLELLTLRATGRLDPQRADLVIVPGAAGKPDAIPAILAHAATGLSPLLAEALARPGVTVATVCGGSTPLAMAGLIPGRVATTHHLGMGAPAAPGVRLRHGGHHARHRQRLGARLDRADRARRGDPGRADSPAPATGSHHSRRRRLGSAGDVHGAV